MAIAAHAGVCRAGFEAANPFVFPYRKSEQHFGHRRVIAITMLQIGGTVASTTKCGELKRRYRIEHMRTNYRSSNQPDLEIVDRLAMARYVGLSLTGLIAASVLFCWLVPALGSAFPRGWSLMKANTAVAMLASAFGLFLTGLKRGKHHVWGSLVCASLVLVLAGGSLMEHLTGRKLGLDTLLARDSGAMPGRMSIQTASFLLLLAVLLIGEHWYQGLVYFLDTATMALMLVAIVLSAGYVFVAPHLVGQSAATRTSPQTLACMFLLTFAVAFLRTRDGFFAVFVGVGIGSRSLRTFMPFIAAASFLTIVVSYYFVVWGWLRMSYGAALSAASSSFLLIVLYVFAARTINDLEGSLRDMSLTDPLTTLQNRRGFYLLGEQALRITKRSMIPMTVLFFDVDGLKAVNDTRGHDVGSQLIVSVADLLRACFRESDIVGRVGGDEFAVVVHGRQSDPISGLKRLDEATRAANDTGNKPYVISYSVGEAKSDPELDEAFSELMNRADAGMYKRKLLKKTSRPSRETTQPNPGKIEAAR